MSGKEILVDTNILVYLLKGNDTLEQTLNGKRIIISFITELELIGIKNASESAEAKIHSLLKDCLIIPLREDVKRQYVSLRKKSPLKLADAIVAATALTLNIPIITADKQFRTIKGLKLLSYQP